MDVQPGSVTSDGNGVMVGKGGKLGTGKKATGRKAKGSGVAESQKPKIVAERLDTLVDLHRKAKDANDAANEAITKAAEDSGYLASTVKKLVSAKAGDRFEEKHREIDQQAELFDEVGK